MRAGARAEISLTVRYSPNAPEGGGISGDIEELIDKIYYVPVDDPEQAIRYAIDDLEQCL